MEENFKQRKASFSVDWTTLFERAVMAPAEQHFDAIIFNHLMGVSSDELDEFPGLGNKPAGTYLKGLYLDFYKAQGQEIPKIICFT